MRNRKIRLFTYAIYKDCIDRGDDIGNFDTFLNNVRYRLRQLPIHNMVRGSLNFNINMRDYMGKNFSIVDRIQPYSLSESVIYWIKIRMIAGRHPPIQ